MTSVWNWTDPRTYDQKNQCVKELVALTVGASSVLRLNGRMAVGEKNTNFTASVSVGLVNGGRCRTAQNFTLQ